jgi:xylulokinase
MVIKGVTRELVKDPLGRIYSHMHPEGTWMPGGASSTGGECLDLRYRGNDFRQLDRKARTCVPTSLLVYPLARKGERFPFVCPEAEGFVVGRSRSSAETYAAHLEGVAYLERMAYETLEELGAGIRGDLYTAGGGSRSSVWLQIRANVVGRRISRPRTPEAAMGGAILAASSDTGVGLGNMARSMVHADLSVQPDDAVKTVYDEGYQRFLSEIAQRFKVPTPG